MPEEQLSSYEQDRLRRQELIEQKRLEAQREKEQQQEMTEDINTLPNTLDKEQQYKAQKELRSRIQETAKKRAEAQTKQIAKKATKKAAKSLLKRLIIPVLSAIGSFLGVVGPWILAFMVIILLAAFALSKTCNVVNFLHINFIAEHFGVDCSVINTK